MERTMSVEEKIKRAEEIYERRKQGDVRAFATVNVNDKKDIKLLKRIIIQLLVCTVIYLIIYMINKNDYPFSNDFINKANEVLSYDTNFIEIYQNMQNAIMGWMNQNQDNTSPENSIGGAEETVEEYNQQQSQEEVNQEQTQNSEQDTNQAQENVSNLSQAEQDIINVKNTTTFIKPVEGVISSKYGQRDTATGKVPKNHTGTDIAANMGTKIKAASDGEVVLASEEGDYRKTLKNTNRRS